MRRKRRKPPGLLAQVVPGLLSDLQLRGSSPYTCINNYPAKKKKKKKKDEEEEEDDNDSVSSLSETELESGFEAAWRSTR